MEITYLGNYDFKIKGSSATLIVGSSSIKIEGSKVNPVGPGEYEIMGVSFIGIPSNEDKKNTIFVIEVDGLRICHLGKLDKKLIDSQLKSIGDIDVLLILGKKDQIVVMQQIEPYFIIPMGEDPEEFLKETGMPAEKVNKFSLKKGSIIDDQPAKVVVLEKK